MKKILAFTLAETLIVIGIIGIVSALTLPNLNASTGEKEKVAKLKKIHTDLEQAFRMAKMKYGPLRSWTVNDSSVEDKYKRIGERITEFMKVSKTCGTSTGCFSTSPLKHLNNTKWQENDVQTLSNNKAYMYILNNGASIAFGRGHGDNIFAIRIDLDGPNQGKNQAGYDRFSIWINNDLEIDINRGGGIFIVDSYSPFSWVISNDNMDYLKCADTLNWNTKITCK